MSRKEWVKVRIQHIEHLSSNLRFFAKKIEKGSDRYNKFWRQLIADSLKYYANEIDGTEPTVLKILTIKEKESNNGESHIRRTCVG